ncbi:MAG: hypothetical protein HY718_00485, partial [Planctomycetes bacterium]|nr:hypothetical protein [Planctomycetota bacterium]
MTSSKTFRRPARTNHGFDLHGRWAPGRAFCLLIGVGAVLIPAVGVRAAAVVLPRVTQTLSADTQGGTYTPLGTAPAIYETADGQ